MLFKRTKSTRNSESGSLEIKRSKRRLWLWVLLVLFGIILALGIACFVWYQGSLTPKAPNTKETVSFTVASGETAEVIADNLESKGVIKSSFAFQLYTQFAKIKHQLQAGSYLLSPAQAVEEIAKKLSRGDTDQFMVTILPGSTLKDIKVTLKKAGFAEADIDAAFGTRYDHPLLAKKPPTASLEGYIFPDSYQVESNESAESLLKRSFDVFQQKLEQENLQAKFAAHRLSLHEALTLASIVQKEVGEADARQVAQVFYSRLEKDMPLGADATFIYAAELLGVEPRVTLDSPYNTREVKGLPPGPIGNMTIAMLEAIAEPAQGDYLYFVSGDDGTTYFSRTEAEHEEKTRKYCIENCAIFRN